MKKLLVLSLAIVMMFAMASTCFAVTANTTTPATNNVTATYQKGGTSEKIYSVDVQFGAMSFTYTGASEGTWNPATHNYDDIDEATWGDNTTAAIKVTNHSNAAVAVSVTYAKAAGYEGSVTAEISGGTFDLDSAVGTTFANAPSKTATLTIGGTATNEAATHVGTVTVSIAAK